MTVDDLKRWRRKRRLSQSELAELLRVHLNTVNRWERGETPIPPYLDLALETLERRVPA